MTISIGGTAFHFLDQFEEAFRLADQALYTAKNTGRNRVEFVVSAEKKSKN